MGAIAGPGSGPPLSGPGVTAPSLSGAGRRFLSDILVELGFVDPVDAEHAVEAARHPGQTPEKVLLESGAIVLAVSDPADSLGLSDIAVMTKLPVRPAVAARSQIKNLLETLDFMEEPTGGALH